MNDIEIINLTKEYKIYKKPINRILDTFLNTKKYTKHIALNNINLNIAKGEAVGVLGKNGAGKSTLLKILTGVTQPTSGKVNINGKIAAILELNSGFDEELTGRENIFLKGAILGYSKNEISSKLENIISFADLGKYIEQPVRTYSSGMKSRLGFAIAVNVDPDILIIDEALSVGDDIFKTKCLKKMTEFRQAGKTIFFVSHSIFTVKSFCSKCMWINNGKLLDYGDTGSVIAKYETFLKQEKAKQIKEIKSKSKDDALERKDYIKISKFNFKENKNIFKYKEDIEYSFDYEVKKEMDGLRWSFTIRDAEEREIYSTDKMNECYSINSDLGLHNLSIRLKNLKLLPGEYMLSGEIRDSSGLIYVGYSNKRAFTIEQSKNYEGSGIIFIEHEIVDNI